MAGAGPTGASNNLDPGTLALQQHLAPNPLGSRAKPRTPILSGDPIDNAVTITQVNFNWCTPAEINEKLTDNAASLGGQRRVNNVIPRLMRSQAMLKAIYLGARGVSLSPHFVAAALFTELDPAYKGGAIDTYYGIGMDYFLEQYSDIVAEGLLPNDFNKQFTRTNQKVPNEANHVVRIAKFKRFAKAMQGFAAFLAHRRKLMLADLANEGIAEGDLTEDELDYWTYVYYNSEHAKKHLTEERVKKKGKSGVAVPTEKIQDADKNTFGLGNAQRMLAIKRLLQWAGMVDPANASSFHYDFHLDGLIQKALK